MFLLSFFLDQSSLASSRWHSWNSPQNVDGRQRVIFYSRSSIFPKGVKTSHFGTFWLFWCHNFVGKIRRHSKIQRTSKKSRVYLCRCSGTCTTRRWRAGVSEWWPTSSPSAAWPTPLCAMRSTSSCATSRSRDRLPATKVRPYRGPGSWWLTACPASNRPTRSGTTCSSTLLFIYLGLYVQKRQS